MSIVKKNISFLGIMVIFAVYPMPLGAAYETKEMVVQDRPQPEKKGFFRKLGDKVTTLGRSPEEKERLIRQRDRKRADLLKQRKLSVRNEQLARDRASQEKKDRQRAKKIKKQRARNKNR